MNPDPNPCPVSDSGLFLHQLHAQQTRFKERPKCIFDVTLFHQCPAKCLSYIGIPRSVNIASIPHSLPVGPRLRRPEVHAFLIVEQNALVTAVEPAADLDPVPPGP